MIRSRGYIRKLPHRVTVGSARGVFRYTPANLASGVSQFSRPRFESQLTGFGPSVLDGLRISVRLGSALLCGKMAD